MDNFDEFIRKKSQYKEARTEKYKYDSKDRLSKILKKKVENCWRWWRMSFFRYGRGTKSPLKYANVNEDSLITKKFLNCYIGCEIHH